jgi:hypothetical protein
MEGLAPFASMALLPVRSLAQMEQDARAENTRRQARPVVQALAGHVRKRWEAAKRAKVDVEARMADNLRRRRGEYDSAKLAEIKQFGGSDIFLGITSVKCRSAAAWLRETLLGVGNDRPWQLDATPVPELPPDVMQALRASLEQQLMAALQGGTRFDQETLRAAAQGMKDKALRELREQAKQRVERMADRIEDQLVEGGWTSALSQFIDDLVTFPAAIVKGPVPRNRKQFEWTDGALTAVEKLQLEWERVDPFMFYPAPWATSVDDGPMIERHRLTRDDLQAMVGVEGYDDAAIKTVLADFEAGGLHEWLWVDAAKADAEGKLYSAAAWSDEDLIDALQLWDSVPGKLLVDWGLDAAEIDDPFKSYPCEVWLVGSTVIRAVLNYDPLGRKGYYATSYEKIPGVFWGNSVVDLVRDPQDVTNAAARALTNNMGIASGPQAVVDVSRLPPGEDITNMYPWKIWQTSDTDFGASSSAKPPITFFQPNSNAVELLTVMEKFGALADEYSGIPKYMTGEHVAGAGRTSSGLSMLINNAAKSLKHVVGNVDQDVIAPMLERIYQHNLRYAPNPDDIGDVKIVARGAMSLVSREAAAVRRNEFLQTVLTSPLAQQIVGLNGAAELLRENARLLDVNPDRIVPSREDMVAAQAALQQQAAAQQVPPPVPGTPGAPPQQGMPGSAPTLPDGSLEGGRDSNFVSPRPSGT